MADTTEQHAPEFSAEHTEWETWVNPARHAAQAAKFMKYANISEIPAEPWPEESAEVKQIDPILAELFPDLRTAMAPETADKADAFICFMGECFIKFAGAQWINFKWFGRSKSFYDHINPAIRIDNQDNDVDTVWGLMQRIITCDPEVYSGMFSYFAAALREYAATHDDKRRQDASR